MMKIKKEIVERIKRIERCAYPEEYISFGDVNSLNDFAEYMDCNLNEVHIKVNNSAYLLYSKIGNYIYIADFASIGKPTDAVGLLLEFLKKYKGYEIECDARKSTSYPFIKVLERRGLIRITNEKKSLMFDDEVNVHFTIKNE